MKNVCLLALFLVQPAFGAVNLMEKDDWKVDMSGFVETDLFYDSTKSFTEVIGNNAVVRPSASSGERTQMSIRNSRLAFNVQAPTMEDWKSRGYFEFDLLGVDPSPGNFASASGAGVTSTSQTQSEASFFNNPTMRVRHAYIGAENGSWQFLTGQTWELMGWQPYYFIPTIQVAPIPGMLYNRTVQMRSMKTLEMNGDNTLQLAFGLFRPPQRDAKLPSLEAGARWAMNSRTAAFTGGATGGHKPQPLSVGVSGTMRNLDAPDATGKTTTKTGQAVAVDILIPVIASSDGKDISHNLVIGGEYSIGQGYGDEFSGWTGGQKNPLNAGAAPDSAVNLDAGIGGYDANANFGLIQLQTMNIYAQYHLPEHTHTWVAAGYSVLSSSNLTNFNAGNSALGYDKEEAFFVNIAHDCSKQIRTGLEWAQINTHYSMDGFVATDNRVQYSAWFIF